MTDFVSFVEDEIVEYILQEYAGKELARFTCMGAVLGSLPPDMVDDLKEAMWERIQYYLRGRCMLARIADCLPEESSDEEE